MSNQNIRAIMVAFMLFAFAAIGYSQDTREYDANISKLVGKLTQYPQKAKLMSDLGGSFRLANQSDLDLINQYKQTGQPDIWYAIYQAHDRIAKRQELVKTLPDKTIQQSGITFIDNSSDLEEARVRAARYSYAIAQKMLNDSTPASARTAYVELLRVARLKFAQASGLDKFMRRAILLGSTDLEFELYNRSGSKLTGAVTDRLNQIVWEYKRAKNVQTPAEPPATPFKFTIRVVIDEIGVGPDQVKHLTYEEQRDLFSGNEVVDTIDCLVDEYRQLKKANIGGRIDFYDNQLNQVVVTVPVSVETVFSNAFATLQGNPDAAGEETVRLLSSREAAYPSSEEMISLATDEFVKKATEVLLAQ